MLNPGGLWGGGHRLFSVLTRFIVGTSATLFNQAFLALNSSTADSVIVAAVQEVLQNLGEAEDDVAVYPNSFHGWNAETNPVGSARGFCEGRW